MSKMWKIGGEGLDDGGCGGVLMREGLQWLKGKSCAESKTWQGSWCDGRTVEGDVFQAMELCNGHLGGFERLDMGMKQGI